MRSQLPKVIPQNIFSIDFSVFPIYLKLYVGNSVELQLQ